ncbi:MAG TPA: sulfopyruvate decarboxylase subunit alpha [Methanothrix sp.]|nr:sulfopyruvate decarboxylase subunit alpha [Methanothrix sp.]HRW82919.1 sulfopyruvate decarboxylase subunit alpha [Methanothrix sp.]
MNGIDPSRAVYAGMKRAGIDFVASVPCVNLDRLIAIAASDPDTTHVPATREEEGVGICAGAYLGGKRPALLMQNSGLGNSINALASLNGLYRIPLLLIISHRGGEGETIAGQVPMGRMTPKLLEAMQIPRFAPDPSEAEDIVAQAAKIAWADGTPAAVLLDIRFWRGRSL